MSTLTTIGLLAVAAVVTLMRAGKLSRTTESTPLWLFGVTLAGAGLAWPFATYLEWAMGNPLTIGLAALVGIGIGYLWPEYLLGFAIGFVLNGTAAAPALIWSAAMIAGYAVLRLRFNRWVWDRLTSWHVNRALTREIRHLRLERGERPRGIDWDDALWWVAAAMTVIPLVVGAFTLDPWTAATGVLVTAAVLLRVLDLRRLTRKFRRYNVSYVAVQVPAVALLAAGPLGALQAPESWVDPVVTVIAFGVGLWLAGRGRPEGRMLRSAGTGLLTVFGWLSGTFVAAGMFPFYASVFHPRPWLLVVAALLAVIEIVLRVRSGGIPMLAQNVTAVVSRFDAHEEIAEWARDTVRRRPKRPDLRLLTLLIGQSMKAPHRAPLAYDLYGHIGGYRRELSSETSLEWLELAEHALDELDRAAPHLRRELLARRADCAFARANLHGYLSQREENAAAYRRAMWLFSEAGMPSGEGFARMMLGMSLGMRLRRRAEGMAELVPLFDDERLSPAVRRRAVSVAMMVARSFDDEDEVSALRARRDLIVATKAHYWALFRETTPLDSWRVMRATVRVSMRQFQEEELLFDLHSPTGTEHLPAGKGLFPVPERELLDAGRLLASRGNTKRALVVLEEAAQLAETQGHPQFVLMARSAIADLHVRQGDRVAAWRNLATAIGAHQRIRGLVLDQDARSDVGGLWADLFDRGVTILAGEPVTPTPVGWPARSHTAAFELGESARSRALLELLGSRLDPGAVQGIPADEERAALERLHEARGALDAAGPDSREKAQVAVRQAATTLDRLYDDWRRNGGQAAEYVSLRRGQPATYAEIRTLLAG